MTEDHPDYYFAIFNFTCGRDSFLFVCSEEKLTSSQRLLLMRQRDTNPELRENRETFRILNTEHNNQYIRVYKNLEYNKNPLTLYA